MDNNCPTPSFRVLTGRNSKSPNLTVSSPESEGRKSPGDRPSPDSRCAICLGKLHKKSFTDSCLHPFCFQCLLQWSKVKPECPLCKQPFKSIIYNVRSNFDYDQYHIERREPAYVVSEILHAYDFDLVPVDARVRYRSTMTREYFGELSFLTGARTSYQVPNFVATPTFHIQPSARFSPVPERRGTRNGSDFRRRIYEQDLWVRDLADITGRYRDCTPQFYRENPAQIHRIIPWLNREINSLMDDNESYTAYILDRILSFLPQYPIRSLEFRSIVEPYFGPRTDHFIHEFYAFSRSVYDITGFDQHASYAPNPNYATEVQEISSSNEDSEIEIIGTLQKKNGTSARSRRNNFKKISKNTGTNSNEPVAGPSGINNSRATETIEVVEDDNDDIKVIDYVKPEPEVITLSSGDEIPSFSGNQKSKTVKKNGANDKNSDDSFGEFSDNPGKRSRSCNNRNKRHRSRAKCKSEESESKPKSKHYFGHKKRRTSSGSSSNSSTSECTKSNSRTPKESSRYSTSTTSVYSRSSSSSSDRDRSSSSDFEQVSKAKRKKLSKGHYKKMKRAHPRKHQHKDSKTHVARKSKVKSCVVIPKSNEKNGETSHNYSRHSQTLHYSVNSRTENESSTSAPSYWSMVLNNNTENPWSRKSNSRE